MRHPRVYHNSTICSNSISNRLPALMARLVVCQVVVITNRAETVETRETLRRVTEPVVSTPEAEGRTPLHGEGTTIPTSSRAEEIPHCGDLMRLRGVLIVLLLAPHPAVELAGLPRWAIHPHHMGVLVVLLALGNEYLRAMVSAARLLQGVLRLSPLTHLARRLHIEEEGK